MTASELVTALRSKANQLATNAEVSSIDGLTFDLTNGKERIVKFNKDKSWRLKPVEADGFVRIEWLDEDKTYSNIIGNKYTIIESVEDIRLDPSQIIGFRFNYTIKRETNVNIDSDTEPDE